MSYSAILYESAFHLNYLQQHVLIKKMSLYIIHNFWIIYTTMKSCLHVYEQDLQNLQDVLVFLCQWQLDKIEQTFQLKTENVLCILAVHLHVSGVLGAWKQFFILFSFLVFAKSLSKSASFWKWYGVIASVQTTKTRIWKKGVIMRMRFKCSVCV